MNNIKENQIYKHFKGNYYIVIGTGLHTETNEDMVIYKALYSDNKLFVRPLNMFIEKVDKKKYPDINQEYRFELVNLGEDKNE